MLNSLAVSDLFIFLVTIKHGNDVYRFTQMHTEVTSRGEVYKPIGLDIKWPSPRDTLPRVSVAFDNVGLDLIDEFREFIDPPTISVELTTSVSPDIIEKSYTDIKVDSVEYNVASLSCTGTVKNMLSKQFPSEKYDVIGFNGIHYI